MCATRSSNPAVVDLIAHSYSVGEVMNLLIEYSTSYLLVLP
jgi:hypothetical protein